jgi:hypothetical protein
VYAIDFISNDSALMLRPPGRTAEHATLLSASSSSCCHPAFPAPLSSQPRSRYQAHGLIASSRLSLSSSSSLCSPASLAPPAASPPPPPSVLLYSHRRRRHPPPTPQHRPPPSPLALICGGGDRWRRPCCCAPRLHRRGSASYLHRHCHEFLLMLLIPLSHIRILQPIWSTEFRRIPRDFLEYYYTLTEKGGCQRMAI